MPSTPKTRAATPPIKAMTPVVASPPAFFEVGLAVSLAAASAWPDAPPAAIAGETGALPSSMARAGVVYLDALERLCGLYGAPELLLRADVPDILHGLARDGNASAPLRLFLRRAMLAVAEQVKSCGVQPPSIDWDAQP